MEIFVRSKDLDCGYDYTFFVTKEQARQILEAQPGEVVSLGEEGFFVKVGTNTVTVRNGSYGGTSELNKLDVFTQLLGE